MDRKSLTFLEALMTAPSPSGYEDRARDVWRAEMESCVDQVTRDVHGNSMAWVNPGKRPRIMLAGHIDELGFQVRYIDKNGFVFFSPLGGFDEGLVPGRKVRILGREGDVLGVIGRKPVHLIEKEERDKAARLTDLYIDTGARTGKEAAKLVAVGDPVTYDANFETLRNDRYVSRAFDDKIGAFVAAAVARRVYRRRASFDACLCAVATVQEELGLRGARTSAYAVDPQVGIAIDVAHAMDTPDADVKKHGEVKLGQGAVIVRGPNINTRLFELLVRSARKNRRPYQVSAAPGGTGTDANVIQLTKAGVATGLISVPCRYMHTFTEVVCLTDVASCINILTAFCLAVSGKTDFTL